MRIVKAISILSVAGIAIADPVLDRITVTNSVPMSSTTNLDFAGGFALCPDETILLTGGALILSDNGGVPPGVAMVASLPQGNGWTAYAREMVDVPSSNVNLMVSAVCGIVHNSFSPHLRIVQSSANLNRTSASLDIASASADCPAGFSLVSGGASLRGPGGSVPVQAALVRNRPIGNGWYAVAREIVNVPTNSATLTVHAVCADAGSGLSSPVTASAVSNFTESPNLDSGAAIASCPAGKTVFGGGADILMSNGGLPPTVALTTTEPQSGNRWRGIGWESIHQTRAPLIMSITTFGQCFSTSGVSGVETVSRNFSLSNTSTLLDAVSGAVQCPVGKSMLGGGANIWITNNATPAALALVSSAPSGNGWTATVRETVDLNRPGTVNLTVSAVCAILPP